MCILVLKHHQSAADVIGINLQKLLTHDSGKIRFTYELVKSYRRSYSRIVRTRIRKSKICYATLQLNKERLLLVFSLMNQSTAA